MQTNAMMSSTTSTFARRGASSSLYSSSIGVLVSRIPRSPVPTCPRTSTTHPATEHWGHNRPVKSGCGSRPVEDPHNIFCSCRPPMGLCVSKDAGTFLYFLSRPVLRKLHEFTLSLTWLVGQLHGHLDAVHVHFRYWCPSNGFRRYFPSFSVVFRLFFRHFPSLFPSISVTWKIDSGAGFSPPTFSVVFRHWPFPGASPLFSVAFFRCFPLFFRCFPSIDGKVTENNFPSFYPL